jgi:endonuclease/exonuclease/phosphatase family metal-dependent hydrolase
MNLCLISCNIRFDNPADGANSWPLRRKLLTSTLLAHSPHVIATQEGRYDQLKNFEELLSDYEIIDQHRSWIKERMYPTFYVKKNVFEIIKSEDLWLSETPDIAGSMSFGSAFPRLFTWMKVQAKDSEKNFIFVNTHLDHVKQETRAKQIKVLAGEVKRIQDQQSTLIIMGDFNDSPDSEVRLIVEREFPELQDAWRLHNSVEETSHHAFIGKAENGARIDWILVDKKAQIENCIMDKKKSEGRYPSDHFPIVCEIKI